MSIDIPAEYVPFVQKAIASGRFESEGALVGEAIRLLREQEELRQSIQRGFDQISRGESVELDEEQLDEYFDALIERAEATASARRTG